MRLPENDVGYDPFSAATLEDPFPAYSELRDRCPVHRYDGFEHPLYTVSRYDDVIELLADVDTWSSHYGQMPRYTVQGCLFSDPPQHTWYRRLIQASFAPRHISAMEGQIIDLVDELLDQIEAGGEVGGEVGGDDGVEADLHEVLACPLPVLVIAHILGVPTDDIEQFKAWSDEQLAASNSSDPRASEGPRNAMNGYLREQLDDRRGALRAAGHDPDRCGPEVLGEVIPDDVIGGILLAEVDGRRLVDGERLVMLNQLLVGGNETTTSLITNLFWRLLERPELYRAICDDPGLAPIAVEESLRMDAPVLGLYRTNTRELTLRDVTLPERSKVMATYGSANRDPSVFEDPDVFRLDRDPEVVRKHLAFGFGRHFCPGAHLSRLEARIALTETVRRFPSLRLAGETTRIEPFLLWGRRTVPVRWA